MDKISPNKNREPGRNWVGYYGRVLSFEVKQPPISEAQPSMSHEPIGDFTFDESQWIEIIKFAQQKNWYSKIEIIGGAVIGSIIEIPVQEIWELLKAHLSKSNESGDDTLSKLMEKIKDLPLEEILEEIGRIFPGLFL